MLSSCIEPVRYIGQCSAVLILQHSDKACYVSGMKEGLVLLDISSYSDLYVDDASRHELPDHSHALDGAA